MITSVGLFAHAILKQGGARAYEDGIWMRFAYAARYGHQRLPDLLKLSSHTLDSFNERLAKLIKQEGGGMSNSMATGG
jgi:hypothetical protein